MFLKPFQNLLLPYLPVARKSVRSVSQSVSQPVRSFSQPVSKSTVNSCSSFRVVEYTKTSTRKQADCFGDLSESADQIRLFWRLIRIGRSNRNGWPPIVDHEVSMLQYKSVFDAFLVFASSINLFHCFPIYCLFTL